MIVAITVIYYNKAKQGSTHKYTKKGTDQRIIQNVRVHGWIWRYKGKPTNVSLFINIFY